MAQGSITGSWWPGTDEPFRFTPDANPYVAHRLTVQMDGQKVACDCGDTFLHIVDLERHQQAYRHPGLSNHWEDE